MTHLKRNEEVDDDASAVVINQPISPHKIDSGFLSLEPLYVKKKNLHSQLLAPADMRVMEEIFERTDPLHSNEEIQTLTLRQPD